MASESNIRVERDGPVGVLTIDRRERLNSLDVRTAQDFRKAGLQLARDNEVRVVLIRGEGGVFCSGADLKYIRDGGEGSDLQYLRPESSDPGYGRVFKQILEYIHSAISEIRRASKPFVAAVDGAAAAGGFGIAMSCDLVLASERAWFEWAYFKTGLSGAESSTFLLPRLVGLRRSLEFILLNPRLSAQEALEWGLVNRVFTDVSFEPQVREVAHRLAASPRSAVATAKGLLNQASGMDRLDVHLDAELSELARVANGADFAEGIEAFFDKRAPKFEEG
ncbi:MAG: enoyl-CoA hydratase-related protein [Myxococcota bacterium]